MYPGMTQPFLRALPAVADVNSSPFSLLDQLSKLPDSSVNQDDVRSSDTTNRFNARNLLEQFVSSFQPESSATMDRIL